MQHLILNAQKSNFGDSMIETQQSVKWSQNLLRIVAYFALDKITQKTHTR